MRRRPGLVGALIGVIAAALPLGSCANLKKDTSVCPEYRSMRCVAGTVCSMDAERHCKVCRCRSMDPSTDTEPDDSRPPDVTPPGIDPSVE